MARDPDILVDLTTASSADAAELLALYLRYEGIPAHVTAHAGATFPLHLGSSQPYRVSVLRRDLQRAREFLRAAPPAPIDWDQVDVGDPEPGDVILSPPASHTKRSWKRWLAMLVFALIALAMLGYGAVIPLGLAVIIEVFARFPTGVKPIDSLA